MGEVQKLTIDGKGYVVISQEDYEDLLDGIAASEVSERIAAGEETWPSELVKALVAGESPVRVFRKHRNLTMAELAEKTSLSQSFISEIENGRKQGSIDALKAIAAALDVALDDLA